MNFNTSYSSRKAVRISVSMSKHELIQLIERERTWSTKSSPHLCRSNSWIRRTEFDLCRQCHIEHLDQNQCHDAQSSNTEEHYALANSRVTLPVSKTTVSSWGGVPTDMLPNHLYIIQKFSGRKKRLAVEKIPHWRSVPLKKSANGRLAGERDLLRLLELNDECDVTLRDDKLSFAGLGDASTPTDTASNPRARVDSMIRGVLV